MTAVSSLSKNAIGKKFDPYRDFVEISDPKPLNVTHFSEMAIQK